ncbi:MAG: hypothetical protein WBS15_06765, partial [Mycobacterium sp.]
GCGRIAHPPMSEPGWSLSVSMTTEGTLMCWKCDHPEATVQEWCAEFTNGQVRQPVLGVRVGLT